MLIGCVVFLDNEKMIAIDEPYTLYNKAPARSGALVTDAAQAFLQKNMERLSKLSPRERRLVYAQFHDNAAFSHKATGNRMGYVRAFTMAALKRPCRPLLAYIEFLDILLGLNLFAAARKRRDQSSESNAG